MLPLATDWKRQHWPGFWDFYIIFFLARTHDDFIYPSIEGNLGGDIEEQWSERWDVCHGNGLLHSDDWKCTLVNDVYGLGLHQKSMMNNRKL